MYDYFCHSYPFNKRSSGSSFGSGNNNHVGETMPFLQTSVTSREGDFADNSFQTQTGSSSHYEVIPAMKRMVESDTSGNAAASTSDEEEG